MGLATSKTDDYTKDILYIAPFVVGCSLIVGCSFFAIRYDWEFPTVIYYSTQTLFGCIYDVPYIKDDDWLGKWFSLGFFIWGVFLVAGAIGAFAITVVENATREEKNRKFYVQMDLDGDGEVGWTDWITYHVVNLAIWCGWYESNRNYLIFIAVFIWLGVGMVYALYYEEYGVLDSLYFSIGTMATAGLPYPRCNGPDLAHCQMDTFRAFFYTIYIIVGVPLFTLTLGQFTLRVVHRAVQHREIQSLRRPLSEEEYRYACSLRAESTGEGNIDFAEFIVMELLRLKKVDIEDITFIKELFDEIDYDHSGIIDRKKLIRQSLIIAEEIQEHSEPLVREMIPELDELIPVCTDMLAISESLHEGEDAGMITPGKYGSLADRDSFDGRSVPSEASYPTDYESGENEEESFRFRPGQWRRTLSDIREEEMQDGEPRTPHSPEYNEERIYPLTPRDVDLTSALNAIMLTAHTRMLESRTVDLNDVNGDDAAGEIRSRSSTTASRWEAAIPMMSFNRTASVQELHQGSDEAV